MPKTKLDLTKEYKSYYTAKTTPEIVEIEEGKFLTIEGKGAPGGKEFQAKVSALYSLAYGIKILMKKGGKDFTVAKLEGLWWIPISHIQRFPVRNGCGNSLSVNPSS